MKKFNLGDTVVLKSKTVYVGEVIHTYHDVGSDIVSYRINIPKEPLILASRENLIAFEEFPQSEFYEALRVTGWSLKDRFK